MNSSLLLSLAITGGLVLAAIVAYNAWILHRNAPKSLAPDPDRPAPVAGDPCLNPPCARNLRSTPTWARATPPAMRTWTRGAEPNEHTVDAGDALRMPVPTHSLERRPGLDPLIDVIASIQPEGLVSGDAAAGRLATTRRAGSKPFAIEGLNDATQQWGDPAPGQRYRSFQAGCNWPTAWARSTRSSSLNS